MDLLTPIVLRSRHASLVPLSAKHCQALIEAASDGELWNIWYASVPSPTNMAAEIERRLGLHKQGVMLPFTVIDNATN
ncbi:MAG: putative N-acetyltransferase (GCN5-related), partial [Burkholderiales bacterium]|nr:putative N-acetyltransferase (GCN5-related) [Burkholderiales bacterium]